MVWAFSMFRARVMPPVAASVPIPAPIVPIVPVTISAVLAIPSPIALLTLEATVCACSIKPESFDLDFSTPESNSLPSYVPLALNT